MFKKKTVDDVVSVFNNAIKELAAIQEDQIMTIGKAQQKIDEQKAIIVEADIENERASRIIEKLYELVK